MESRAITRVWERRMRMLWLVRGVVEEVRWMREGLGLGEDEGPWGRDGQHLRVNCV